MLKHCQVDAVKDTVTVAQCNQSERFSSWVQSRHKTGGRWRTQQLTEKEGRNLLSRPPIAQIKKKIPLSTFGKLLFFNLILP